MQMDSTIFTSPRARRMLRPMSLRLLRWAGWRVDGCLPPEASKCVVVGAPHTSNWDLPIGLLAAFALDLNVRWLGKCQLFRPPIGGLMRWLGGIPVDRSRSHQLVANVATDLAQWPHDLQLIVTPEGTRSKVTQWKTGFYFIAQQADLPIVLGYLDYGRKVAGLGPVLRASGDLDADLARIKAFYAPMRGKRSELFYVG